MRRLTPAVSVESEGLEAALGPVTRGLPKNTGIDAAEETQYCAALEAGNLIDRQLRGRTLKHQSD